MLFEVVPQHQTFIVIFFRDLISTLSSEFDVKGTAEREACGAEGGWGLSFPWGGKNEAVLAQRGGEWSGRSG